MRLGAVLGQRMWWQCPPVLMCVLLLHAIYGATAQLHLQLRNCTTAHWDTMRKRARDKQRAKERRHARESTGADGEAAHKPHNFKGSRALHHQLQHLLTLPVFAVHRTPDGGDGGDGGGGSDSDGGDRDRDRDRGRDRDHDAAGAASSSVIFSIFSSELDKVLQQAKADAKDYITVGGSSRWVGR